MTPNFIETIFTFLIFTLTLCFSPLLFLSYLGVKLSHSLWFNFISYLHPELNFIEETTFRTLSDTHRNQGIITVLLKIKGPPNLDAISRHLKLVLEQTDKFGRIQFPHLKEGLITKYGTYAWQFLEDFDLNQNLIVAPLTFKGRLISDANIQECISDTVSKYLPSGVPPWQMVVFPTSEQHHYILLKLHHVLLTGHLTIRDLLPIKKLQNFDFAPTKTPSPLRNVYQQPEYIPLLKERLTEDLTNAWNEFISNHDPLEKIELLKRSPGVFQFAALVIITCASILKEYRKDIGVIKDTYYAKFLYLKATIRKECWKRQVSFGNLIDSIFVTIHPRNLITTFIEVSWKIFIVTLKIPLFIYKEIIACFTCFRLKYCAYPDTMFGVIYNYTPLIFNASKELLYCIGKVLKTPKNIIEELFSDKDIIQTITLCGRKIVSWSEPIKKDDLKDIAKHLDVSETEIILAACSAGIADYYVQINEEPPKEIAITARNINSAYIFGAKETKENIGGMLCINLPILDLHKPGGYLYNLQSIHQNMNCSLEKQPLTYVVSILQTKYGVLSKLFPATIIGIFLRVLSLKYSVAFTEVSTPCPTIKQETVWGEEVLSAFYWRPPQANICISLCLNQYADHVILGVMTDAQLGPHHSNLVKNFTTHLNNLGITSGLYKYNDQFMLS